jgi:hypothetical protein
MKRNTFRIAVACFALIGFIVVPGASADVMLKQKHHVDSFTFAGKTQPAKDYVGTQWIAEDKARNDMDDKSVIVLLGRNLMIILDHPKKTYMEIPLNFAEDAAKKAKAEGGEMPEGMPEQMQKLMQGMLKGMTFKVTETKEKAVINGWNCRKYLQTVEGGVAPSSTELWASTDVAIDAKLLSTISAAMMAVQPGLKEALGDIQKETEKIKGVTVKTTTTSTVMNSKMQSSMELLEVKNNITAPADVFEVPVGYKKTDGF